MQLTSFRLQRTLRPMHTPDRLLNAYLACRTPPRRQTPGLISLLLYGLLRACGKAIHRARHASR